MARIVGIVRSASAIAPWGTFLSFNLQNALTAAAKNAFSDKRKWWTHSRIYLSTVAVATINQLLETLLAPENPIESALVANIHTVMAIWMMTNGLPCFREQVIWLVLSIKKIGTIAIEYRK
jgi:hypothetical protein